MGNRTGIGEGIEIEGASLDVCVSCMPQARKLQLFEDIGKLARELVKTNYKRLRNDTCIEHAFMTAAISRMIGLHAEVYSIAIPYHFFCVISERADSMEGQSNEGSLDDEWAIYAIDSYPEGFSICPPGSIRVRELYAGENWSYEDGSPLSEKGCGLHSKSTFLDLETAAVEIAAEEVSRIIPLMQVSTDPREQTG